MATMKLVLVVMVAMACGPGLRSEPAQFRNPKLPDFAAQLSQASKNHDVAAIRTLLGDGLMLGGMWFDDVECMTKFVAPGEITGPRLDAFARCLSMIDLAPSSRVDRLPDVAVLTYGAGLELEARFVETRKGPWLAWIGYVARRDAQDALPTISGSSLESLRIDGDPQAAIAGPGAFDELASTGFAYAWLKVCIDTTGVVTSANVREASSPKAARTFGAATATWKFRPFTLRGQPAPVCSMVQMRYPAGAPPKRETLPLPLPAQPAAFTNLPPTALGMRIAGSSLVVPDDMDKARIAHAGVPRLLSAFHYCIDETGHVNHVALLRSSGLEGYDRKQIAAIRSWVYKPYLDEGKPVGVCSTIHFIYSQGQRGQQPGMMTFAR